jgi:hypothetical protein
MKKSMIALAVLSVLSVAASAASTSTLPAMGKVPAPKRTAPPPPSPVPDWLTSLGGTKPPTSLVAPPPTYADRSPASSVLMT